MQEWQESGDPNFESKVPSKAHKKNKEFEPFEPLILFYLFAVVLFL